MEIKINDFQVKALELGVDGLKLKISFGRDTLEFQSKEMAIRDISNDIERTTEMEVFWDGLCAGFRKKVAGLELERDRVLAHWRKFVKFWLKGRGEKDTIEGRLDGLFLLFSKETSEKERRRNAIFSWKGYGMEIQRVLDTISENDLLKWAESGDDEWIAKINPEFLEFYYEMMKFSFGEDGVFYEDLMAIVNEAKQILETLESISTAFRQKAVLLASVISGRRSLTSLREEVFKIFREFDGENNNNNKEVSK